MSGLLARCKPAALLYNLIITIYQDQDARQLDRVGKPGQTDGRARSAPPPGPRRLSPPRMGVWMHPGHATKLGVGEGDEGQVKGAGQSGGGLAPER